jgi:hypothetical protein
VVVQIGRHVTGRYRQNCVIDAGRSGQVLLLQYMSAGDGLSESRARVCGARKKVWQKGEGVQRRECALRHVGGHVASAAPSAACAALLRLQNNHMRRAIRHNTAKRARGEVGW